MIPASVRSRIVRWGLNGASALGVSTIEHRLKCGRSMILDTRDHLANRIRLEETFEPAVRKEYERLASARINILDVGANIGYYSLIGAAVIGPDKRVFAFEPQMEVVNKLRRNIQHNAIKNISVFQIALSDEAGIATFCIPSHGAEAFGSFHSNGRFHVAKTVDVQTRRLDDVIAEHSIPEIGLIKLDAEGAEFPILRGATRLLSSDNRPALIFEAHEGNVRPFGYCVFDLLKYVHGFGYRLRQLDNEDWLAEPQ